MHDINFIISIFLKTFMVLFEGIKSQIHLGSFALIIRFMMFSNVINLYKTINIFKYTRGKIWLKVWIKKRTQKENLKKA